MFFLYLRRQTFLCSPFLISNGARAAIGAECSALSLSDLNLQHNGCKELGKAQRGVFGCCRYLIMLLGVRALPGTGQSGFSLCF